MADVLLRPDLTPWKPKPAQIPEEWINLANKLALEAKGSQHAHILTVRYNAQRVGNLLHSWGLPWQVVIAGYLWEYDKDLIRQSNLEDVDEVLSHINEANLYARYIEDENLPPLLTPPYRDLGGLLIAIAIYYQALRTLQEQSNERPYTGRIQSDIESIGRTLLNMAKSLGMWHFKREVEDLTEQLRSPRKFTELKKEHARLLEQDAILLEDTRQWLIEMYRRATKNPIEIVYSPCGIVGLKRRLQDVHAMGGPNKTQLNAFDLVIFDAIVPTVQECYAAFGVLSQLGYIRDRIVEQMATPKPNGYSIINYNLVLKPQGPYTQGLKWPETYTRICNLQIATNFMHAIRWYGCLYPDYYELYTKASLQAHIVPPPIERLWTSQEGKVFLAVSELLANQHARPEVKAPIVVYNKDHNPIALPKGATALDFAYALDSTVGGHAVEAFINNRQAPLYRVLDAGDIVEIRTTNEIQVQDYWLSENYTRTTTVRRQIRESLDRRSLNRQGYNLLHQTLERYHFMLTKEDLDQELNLMLKQHDLGPLQAYLKRLDRAEKPPYTPEWAAQEIMQQIAERNEPLAAGRGRSSWVPVLDMQLTTNKKLYQQQRLCNLCQPTYPRDIKIMGRLRRRSGELIVHKVGCPHLIDRSKSQRSVLLPMTWQLQAPAFIVAFLAVAQDRKGLIFDLSKQLRQHQCDLISINAEAITKFGEARIRFTIEAYDDKEVLDIWEELCKIENVTRVTIDATHTPIRTRDRLLKLRRQQARLPKQIITEHDWEELIATLQPRRMILQNPFDISRPATTKMFFGRSEELKTMQRELCDAERGKALILYGPRRSGKSSICKNFLETQVPPPFWSVFFSLQGANQQTEETILMQLAERVSWEFSEQLQQPVPDQQLNDCDPQLRFKRLLQACIAQVPNSRLVLVLDEFGGALQSYERSILEQRFFTYWKHLMSEIPQLSLVMVLPTSSHNLLSSKDFGDAFNFAEPLPVMFLDTKSAEQLLVDPLRDQNIGIYPNTVALAVKLTGGNPYYMTLIGQQLIHQLNRDADKQLVTDEDLRLIVDQLIETGFNQNFVYLKEEFQSNEEIQILEGLVELTTRTNQSKAQLKRIASWLNLPVSVTRQHLERLRNGLILQENGPSTNPYYSFTIELVQRWLTRNHWFFTSTTSVQSVEEYI